MRSSAWIPITALYCFWSSHVLCREDPPEAAPANSHPGLVAVDASDPQYLVYEVRQLEVVLAENGHPPGKPDTERHLQEKKRLLQRMDKKHGTWNEHHPRHRLLEALRGFSAYAETQQAELNRLKGLYSHVPKKQKNILEREIKYSQKFADIAERLQKNQQLCDEIVQTAMEFYGIDQNELDQHTKSMKAAGRAADRISVSQALKHYVRDWAESGANERDAAFPCILNAVKNLFPDAEQDGVKVLLPGAGLGRLGHEVAKLPGFQVTNNEWSAYQNLAYRFLEQQQQQPAHTHNHSQTHTIHPFLDSWSHHRTTADMLRPVTFPHVPFNPRSVVLVEGDFTTAFQDHDSAARYDVVITHFFIDTARNLMSYLDTIARVLRPGGHWVNFGPLLYGSAPFVQLSLEEVLAVVEGGMAFEFLEVAPADWKAEVPLARCGGGRGGTELIPRKRVYGVEAVYGFDERALTRNAYEAVFWVARKEA